MPTIWTAGDRHLVLCGGQDNHAKVTAKIHATYPIIHIIH